MREDDVVVNGVGLKMPDQGGAKSTSRYIVEVLCVVSVYGMLCFSYIMFLAEGTCNDVDNICAENGCGA